MINTTLAKRYAKALVEIGQEKDALDKYAQDLAAVTQLMSISRDFREILINPVFTKDDKKKIAGQVLQKIKYRSNGNQLHLRIDRS